MKALLDTGVWFRRYHGLPMSQTLRDFLKEEVVEFHICPLSVAEICFKWQRGRLPGIPNPRTWIEHSLQNFVIEMPDANVATLAGLWDWSHGDLVDRTLAAIAKDKELTLIHTDKVLKDFPGFPQKWFKNVAE
jgi:PIN domain nuclease of toxin-antitoxin system